LGNIVAGGILVILFGAICYYLLYSIKTKGTTCTSCTSCPVVNKCNKDTIKKEILQFYKNQA